MAYGKWSQQGVPHRGWQFHDLEDLGDLVGTCQMCETQSIRYVHYMKHPDYPDMLGVGSVCAGNMEENYAAPKERESRAISIAARRKRWMEAEWRESERGNSFINRDGCNIVLYRRSGRWAYRIEERQTEEQWSAPGFASEDEAKLAAFNRFVELRG